MPVPARADDERPADFQAMTLDSLTPSADIGRGASALADPGEWDEAGVGTNGGAARDTELFRPEALTAARDRFGAPAPLVALTNGMLTFFLLAILVAAGIFLGTARYARKETVAGVMQPASGVMRVVAPRAGTVGAVHVRENQEIAQGQSLVTLETDPTTERGSRLSELLVVAADDQASSLKQQVAAAGTAMRWAQQEMVEKRQALRRQLDHLHRAVALQRQRIALAEQTAESSRTLYEKRFLSAVLMRQREDAVIVARQALAEAEQTAASIPSQIAELDAQERRLVADGDQSRAGLNLRLAELQEKRATVGADSRINLVAQTGGRVAFLHAKPGAAVAANSAVAMILPHGAYLQAELWVPSRAIGFVRPGNRVRLLYDAFPYQRFGFGGGVVADVDRAPTSPGDLPVPIKTEEALYRVIVRVEKQHVSGYGKNWPLVPGMRLTADVILEDQTLLGWVFDQVRASTMRGWGL